MWPELIPQTAAVVTGFTVAFLLVYLVGFFNLDTADAAAQFAKGMFKFVVHFLFLVAGVAYLARHSERLYWRALGFFCAGIVFNGATSLSAAVLGGLLQWLGQAPPEALGVRAALLVAAMSTAAGALIFVRYPETAVR